MKITYRPIETYPGTRTRFPKPSQFSAAWTDTLGLLERELLHLGAKEVIFQLDLQEAEIRLDGMPRANARPMSAAVVIAFQSIHGPLQFATDLFLAWQDNVRAIALGLESLRRVDRYGITKNAQQYTGWRQLPSNEPSERVMSFEDAAHFVAEAAGDVNWWYEIVADHSFAKALYRDAAKNLHPDSGGDVRQFQALQEAMRVINKGG